MRDVRKIDEQLDAQLTEMRIEKESITYLLCVRKGRVYDDGEGWRVGVKKVWKKEA